MGTLDFRAAEFREPHKVDQELRRVYDICAGCRRCLPLCPHPRERRQDPTPDHERRRAVADNQNSLTAGPRGPQPLRV